MLLKAEFVTAPNAAPFLYWNSEPDPAGVPPLPQPVHEFTVRAPMFPVVAKRLVDEAVVAKKLVVVALVPVALVNVKAWSVVEPVWRAVENEDNPETESVPRVPSEVREEAVTPAARVLPVRLRAETDPAEPVTFPVRFPEAEVKKRLVVEAVVAKKLVVVALVVVLLVTMMSVRPLRVERLLRVVVAARAVSNRAWV